MVCVYYWLIVDVVMIGCVVDWLYDVVVVVGWGKISWRLIGGWCWMLLVMFVGMGLLLVRIIWLLIVLWVVYVSSGWCVWVKFRGMLILFGIGWVCCWLLIVIL